MDRKFLEELGLEKESVDKVMKEHGKSINDYKERAEKADALKSQVDDYQGQLKDRDKQLKELKKVDPEKLQERIDELEEENETKDTEYQEKLEKQAKDFAIESALRDAKARNPKIAKTALDVEAITIKDGKLIGVDEQLEAIKESDAYLFESEEDNLPGGLKGRKPNEGGSDTQGIKNPWSKETFNLTEQAKILKENPELAKQLQSNK